MLQNGEQESFVVLGGRPESKKGRNVKRGRLSPRNLEGRRRSRAGATHRRMIKEVRQYEKGLLGKTGNRIDRDCKKGWVKIHSKTANLKGKPERWVVFPVPVRT